MKQNFSTPVRVRYADTDKMGIVYNANYLTWFEIGRTELLRSIGLPYVELESNGYLLPVKETFIDFISPVYYDQVVEVGAELDLAPHSAVLKINYEITCDSITVAKGYTRHVFVRSRDFRPVRPPSIFLSALSVYHGHCVGSYV